MYHIQLLLMARLLSISHILSSKNSQLSYLDLGNKVKAALNDERGVTSKILEMLNLPFIQLLGKMVVRKK